MTKGTAFLKQVGFGLICAATASLISLLFSLLRFHPEWINPVIYAAGFVIPCLVRYKKEKKTTLFITAVIGAFVMWLAILALQRKAFFIGLEPIGVMLRSALHSAIILGAFLKFFALLSIMYIILAFIFAAVLDGRFGKAALSAAETAVAVTEKTKYVNAWGKVTKGDYAGCFVWRFTNDLYVIADSNKTSYKVGYLGCDYGSLEQLENYLRQRQQGELSSAVVEKIVEISSYQSGPSAAAFIDGALTAGVGYGMAKAMGSMHSSATFAVYLKDEKKLMIEFFSIENATMFKNEVYSL